MIVSIGKCQMFQHAAARRRLSGRPGKLLAKQQFQHAAARRRLKFVSVVFFFRKSFQHAAARRRLRIYANAFLRGLDSFNTQPPEGG